MKGGRGFTLVEVLVVLVITSLVSTVLFQALSHVYRLQSRFGDQIASSQIGAMRVDWWRQVLQGLETDFVDGPRRFTGRGDRLEGFSTQGLGPDPIGPRAFSMELVGNELRYRSGEETTVLLRWPDGGRAEFVYLDADGARQPQWPPLLTRDGWPQLPVAVLLRRSTPDGPEVLVAAPRGSREARVRAFQLGGQP